MEGKRERGQRKGSNLEILRKDQGLWGGAL